MSEVYSSPEAIQHLAWSLAQYQARASEGINAANRAEARVSETVARALRVRTGEVGRAREAFEAAERSRREAEHLALKWQTAAAASKWETGIDPGPCPIAIPDTSLERAAMERAQERLEAARNASQRLEAASRDFGRALHRFEQSLGVVSSECRPALAVMAQDLGIYLKAQAAAAAAWSAGVSAASAAAQDSEVTSGPRSGRGEATGEPRFPAPEGFPAGIVMVPLSVIVGEPPANSRADYTPADLAWAHEAFHSVIMPGIAHGQTLEDFQLRDAREGRYGMRSYADTYSGFFGEKNRIQLNPVGDGTFTIDNGRHRIQEARAMGLAAIPARICGSKT